MIAALARTFYWRKLIDTGAGASIAEIAATERVSPSYVSRLMQLTLLKPETVLRLLQSQTDGGAVRPLAKFAQPPSVVWERQVHWAWRGESA